MSTISPERQFETTKEQEEALCGAVMRDGSIYEQAREIVGPEDFRTNNLRTLWTAFENLYIEGLKIDTFSAGDELERMGCMDKFSSGPWHGRVYLSNIRSNGQPRNFMTYANNVKDYANKRRILSVMNTGAGWAQNGRRAKDIVADLMTELSKLTITGVQDEFTAHVKEALSEAYDWSTRAAAGEIVGVPTGFLDLDSLLGSLIAGNMYIVAGRPGRGKTAFLLTIALYAARQGKKVGIFSLEMSRLQVAQRLISQVSDVELARIIKGTTMTADDWSKYNDAIEQLEQLGIVINDLSSINVNQIRQTSRKLKAQGGLDLVIVDYIQLAQAGSDLKKNANREQEVSAISRGLKYLARELDVPVLAAAQLSRAVEQRANGRPVLSDLRESGTLEQDGYAVMFIHRPDLNGEEGAQENVAEIILEKHRNGATGTVNLIWDGSHARFLNAAAKTYSVNQ